MLRWLVVSVTLGVAVVVVGVLAAGLPAVDRVQNVVSPAGLFNGPGQQPRDRMPPNLGAGHGLLGDMEDEPIDERLPVSIVPRAVIRECRFAPYEVQEVPSRHDGEMSHLGTPLLPGEQVDPEDLDEVEVGILVVEMKTGESAKEPVYKVPGRVPRYRPYVDLEPFEPNKLALVKQKQHFRRLKPGAVVKEGQLLGMINPELALDELGMAIAELDASEAKYLASGETKKEAKTRLDRLLSIQKMGGAVAQEEVDGARLTVERYRYEEIENLQGMVTAKKKLGRALTSLNQHEIRARISGVVKVIYKNKGEAVKGVEKGADTVMVLQNSSLLKIDGKVDIQYARSLRAGMEVVVEPVHRESHELAFRGHLEPITGVAVSKNGLIVSASGENQVFVWDRARVNQAKGLLKLHRVRTFVVACTPLDDAAHNYCLTGGEDGIGRLWNLDALTDNVKQVSKPVLEFTDGHHKPITAVAFGPKGKWCATGSDDSTICIWDVATGTKLETLTGHRGKITSVQFASENQLVSASVDQMLLLWNLKENGAVDKIKKLEGRGGEVAMLGVHPNGKQVLFDQGKELRLLSLPDGQYTGSLQNAGAMTFTTMALFSPDGKLILTNGAAEGRLQVWRTPTATTRGYELSQLIWNSPATCGAFSPDGKFVVTGSKDSYLLVWPLPAKEMIEKQLKARIISVDTSLEDSSGVLVHAQMTNPNNLLLAGDKATLVVYPGTK